MEQTPSFQSEHLQARLREKRAESGRSSRQQSRSAGISRGPTPGRDDELLDADESPTTRKTAGRLYQHTPPSTYNCDEREHSSTRRSGAAQVASSSTTRSLGAREMEEHVDKLSKQNFDLKLEIFHRRTKIEELEKKLREYPKLEEENQELLSMNEELVEELEKRDRAVDEAVVMICNLEEKVRLLEAELRQSLRSSSQRSKETQGSEEQSIKEGMARSRNPSEESDERSPRHKMVSPDVSARIAGLSAPTDKNGRLLPSFLSRNEQSTDALRSIYMDGNRVVRPIPSEASLLSRDTRKEDDNLDEALNSPRLSNLSLSDFKSIYGQDATEEPPQIPDGWPRRNEVDPMSLPREDDMSMERRRARTNLWVADRANSPTKQRENVRPTSPDVGQFQSLGDVLQRQDSTARSEASSGRLKRKQGPVAQVSKNSATPDLIGNPIFGQNIFPPTPDTMVTRPSNHSTSSFLQDRNQLEGISNLAQNAALNQMVPSTTANLQVPSQTTSRSTLAPKGFEAFDEPQMPSPEAKTIASPNDFGVSLFRLDSNESDTPRVNHYNAMNAWASLGNAVGPTFAPARNSPSPPRYFSSRRRSAEIASPTFTSSKHHELFSDHNTSPVRDRLYRKTSADAIPTDPASYYDQRQYDDTAAAPSSYRPPPQLVRSNTTSTPSISSKNSRLQARGVSLRQRVAKITRRSSSASAATVETDAQGIQAVPRRSESITRRFRMRRNSGSTNTIEAPSKPQTDDEGAGTKVGRRNSFRAVVAPLFGLDGSSKGAAAPTATTTSLPSPTIPPRSAGSHSQRSGTITSSDGKSFHSFSSGGSPSVFSGGYGTMSYAESGAAPVNFDPTTRRPSTSRRTESRGSATTAGAASPPKSFPRRGQDGYVMGAQGFPYAGPSGRSKSLARR